MTISKLSFPFTMLKDYDFLKFTFYYTNMKVQELVRFLEEWAPPSLQEDYDNSGLLVNQRTEISRVLVSLDCTEAVVDEAVEKGCEMIIAHHPIVFRGLKRFTGKNYVERTVIKAIRNNISIYSIHTNLDNVHTGVNAKIGELLGLENLRILAPKAGLLKKLYTFVPGQHAEAVRNAVFEAGGGGIGDYIECSFSAKGEGTFKGLEGTNPFVGIPGQRHTETELRLEIIYPSYLEPKIISALTGAHPYEEVAYDLVALTNSHPRVGAGMVGTLPIPMKTEDYLKKVKQVMRCGAVKFTKPVKDIVQDIAFCGGSGFFLLENAISSGADIYITSDIKYHEFFDADDRIVLADIGHFESEQFTKDLLAAGIQKKFPNFAVLISETNTNPVNYL